MRLQRHLPDPYECIRNWSHLHNFISVCKYSCLSFSASSLRSFENAAETPHALTHYTAGGRRLTDLTDCCSLWPYTFWEIEVSGPEWTRARRRLTERLPAASAGLCVDAIPTAADDRGQGWQIKHDCHRPDDIAKRLIPFRRCSSTLTQPYTYMPLPATCRLKQKKKKKIQKKK